tara:strand:- start:340 stop:801 length:462 start_codon:yes stop_codon:yes gene_type:complete
MDNIDKKILSIIQKDISLPLSELAKRVGLSKTPCWNRIRNLEEKGIISGKAALLDNNKLNLPITVFLFLSVSHHNREWINEFSNSIKEYDQITEVHRVTGSEMDYILKIIAPSVQKYDEFQQELIRRFQFNKMSSSISLKEMKKTHMLPLTHL